MNLIHFCFLIALLCIIGFVLFVLLKPRIEPFQTTCPTQRTEVDRVLGLFKATPALASAPKPAGCPAPASTFPNVLAPGPSRTPCRLVAPGKTVPEWCGSYSTRLTPVEFDYNRHIWDMTVVKRRYLPGTNSSLPACWSETYRASRKPLDELTDIIVANNRCPDTFVYIMNDLASNSALLALYFPEDQRFTHQGAFIVSTYVQFLAAQILFFQDTFPNRAAELAPARAWLCRLVNTVLPERKRQATNSHFMYLIGESLVAILNMDRPELDRVAAESVYFLMYPFQESDIGEFAYPPSAINVNSLLQLYQAPVGCPDGDPLNTRRCPMFGKFDNGFVDSEKTRQVLIAHYNEYFMQFVFILMFIFKNTGASFPFSQFKPHIQAVVKTLMTASDPPGLLYKQKYQSYYTGSSFDIMNSPQYSTQPKLYDPPEIVEAYYKYIYENGPLPTNTSGSPHMLFDLEVDNKRLETILKRWNTLNPRTIPV
jgi:hypothetical protein